MFAIFIEVLLSFYKCSSEGFDSLARKYFQSFEDFQHFFLFFSKFWNLVVIFLSCPAGLVLFVFKLDSLFERPFREDFVAFKAGSKL
jgi:hypothetical protein